MTTALGCDLSLNHGALVLLRDGQHHVFLYHEKKKVVAAAERHGFYAIHLDNARMKKLSGGDKKLFENMRLERLKSIFSIFVQKTNPSHACVEDYAYGAKSASHLQIGEMGGAMRLVLMHRRVPFRLHEPSSVKMYIAHDGKAEKDAIAIAVQNRWGVSFDAEIDPEGDLADAYGIARLLEDELLLRAGEATLAGRHPKEVEVFNRVTKQNPINLLARPFVEVLT